MADRVIQRNDTAARWQSINPILATGEIGIEIDGAKGYKIGDGKTRWNDLPYPANPTNVVQELGNNENAVPSQKLVTEKLSELGSEMGYIVNGYISSKEIERFFYSTDTSDYVTLIRKVESGEKLIVYTDAFLRGNPAESLIAFTDSENPTSSSAMKLGSSLKLSMGYNEIIVPENAKFVGFTLKFRDEYGEAENKILAKYTDFGIVRLAQRIEESLLSFNNKYEDDKKENGVIYHGYVNSIGNEKFITFTDTSSEDYITALYKVTEGETLIVILDKVFSVNYTLAAFTDSTTINSWTTKLGDCLTLNKGVNKVVVPEGATYFAVTLKFKDGLGVPNEKYVLRENKPSVIGIVEATIDELTTPPSDIIDIFTGGYINYKGNYVEYTGVSYYTDFLEVNNLNTYRISLTEAYEVAAITFYDENKNLIKATISEYLSAEKQYKGYVLSDIPDGTKYVRFSSYKYKLLVEKVNIYSLAKETKPFEGKFWACVGDSLTESNLRATKNYHDYVADELGLIVLNNGISGTGYAARNDVNKAFYQRIKNIQKNIDVITIFGSGNDLSKGYELGQVTDEGTATLCGFINTTITEVQNRYPLKAFGIITPTPWINSEPNQNGSMEAYSNAIVEVCRRRGVPCLDLYHSSNLHPSNASFRSIAYKRDGTYSLSSEEVENSIQVTESLLGYIQEHGVPDAKVGDWVLMSGGGVHPDEEGHKLIAPRFRSFIESLLAY